jgi:hypothetical protein
VWIDDEGDYLRQEPARILAAEMETAIQALVRLASSATVTDFVTKGTVPYSVYCDELYEALLLACRPTQDPESGEENAPPDVKSSY